MQKDKICGTRPSHAKGQNMRHLPMQKDKICGTRPSRVVPHRSTARARPCLTSLFRWEAVTHGDMAAYESEGCFPV